MERRALPPRVCRRNDRRDDGIVNDAVKNEVDYVNHDACPSRDVRLRRTMRRCCSLFGLLTMASAVCSPNVNFAAMIVEARDPSSISRPKLHGFRALPAAETKILRKLRGGGDGASPHTARAAALVKRPSASSKTVSAIVRGGGKSATKTTTTNTPLTLIRVLFLSFYGSLGVLMPYLPVYYHTLGHDGMVIGLLGAVKPLTTFIVAPLWGVLSDRTNAHSTILSLTFLFGLVFQVAVCANDGIAWLVSTVFLSALLNAPVKSLTDYMVLNTLPPEDKSQYGRMRLWGQLGFGLGSSGIGMLLHHRGTGGSSTANVAGEGLGAWFRTHVFTGYRLAFFFHAVVSIPTLVCMQIFRRMELANQSIERSTTTAIASKSSGKSNGNNGGSRIMDGLNHLVRDPDALFFFFLVLVVGVSSGCIENFAYVRMREVGGTGKEMGLSRLVSSLSGGPMFWFSGSITKFFGEETVLMLSLLSYVVRFVVYACMTRPLQGLPAEALRGITFASFWSTGTIYAHKISPPGMEATMLMFLNAMYGGLGQSLGAIIGGKLQSKFGTVKTFLYAGAFDFSFVAFVFTYKRLLSRRRRKRQRALSD